MSSFTIDHVDSESTVLVWVIFNYRVQLEMSPLIGFIS